jgi:hypothetical protein
MRRCLGSNKSSSRNRHKLISRLRTRKLMEMVDSRAIRGVGAVLVGSEV